MFSAISNYIWGPNDAPEQEMMQHPEVDDLTAMEISSMVSSDDEMSKGPLSDEESEWIVIAGKKKSNRKNVPSKRTKVIESPKEVPEVPVPQIPAVRKDEGEKCMDIDASLKKLDVSEKNSVYWERLQPNLDVEIQTFLRRSHVPRPAVQRVLMSEEVIEKTEKKEEVDEELLQQKVDRQKELSLLLEELRPAQKGKKLEEHAKLSRKALSKSNAVREVASAGNGRLRRSDRLNPTMTARSNNNRKMC